MRKHIDDILGQQNTAIDKLAKNYSNIFEMINEINRLVSIGAINENDVKEL